MRGGNRAFIRVHLCRCGLSHSKLHPFYDEGKTTCRDSVKFSIMRASAPPATAKTGCEAHKGTPKLAKERRTSCGGPPDRAL
jgi:CDGSH-type Zn-finger protein